MAFDRETQVHDPQTGMLRDRATGHLIGIEQAPAFKPLDVSDWPQWVEPHPSHVDRQGDNVAVPGWDWHIDRKGRLTVLAENEDAAKRVMAEKREDAPDRRIEPVDEAPGAVPIDPDRVSPRAPAAFEPPLDMPDNQTPRGPGDPPVVEHPEYEDPAWNPVRRSEPSEPAASPAPTPQPDIRAGEPVTIEPVPEVNRQPKIPRRHEED